MTIVLSPPDDSRLVTTDATVTTFGDYEVPANSLVLFTLRFFARSAADYAVWEFSFAMYRDGSGLLTAVGSLHGNAAKTAGAASWTINGTTDGNISARLTVQGAAGVTVTWTINGSFEGLIG